MLPMAKKFISADDRENNLMKWVAFWRRNPHRFVRDYLDLNLFLYQKILIFMMNISTTFMYIAARGSGKSYIIAVYCIVRCILYPETKVIVASGTKKQASLIISEKILSLQKTNKAIDDEILYIKTGMNDTSVHFKNGSKIEAVTSNDNARGYRGNILILDEFRLIDRSVVDDVLKPFLNVMRQPEFQKRPEYRRYPKEQNKTIYISSAWYKSHWSWDSFKDTVKDMMDMKKSFAVANTYVLSIFEGLLNPEQARDDKAKYDKSKWLMEYEAEFVGENDHSYFKMRDIEKNRTISNAFVPPRTEDVIENNLKPRPKNLSTVPRQDTDSEIRIVSLDVALMGGNQNVRNDSAAFTCMRLSPDKDGYRRDILYLETIKRNISSEDLAIRGKQLFYDFEADYFVLDSAGIGTAVLESLCGLLHDKDRDVEYEGWSIIDNEEENERLNATGHPIIVSYKADARFNSEIAVNLKKSFEQKRLRLPVDDIKQRETLIDKGGFLEKDVYEQHRLLYPYLQATALMNELVALEYTTRRGYIVVKEVGKTTKDRYSSLAYCNYYASELEKDLLRENDSEDYDDFISVRGFY